MLRENLERILTHLGVSALEMERRAGLRRGVIAGIRRGDSPRPDTLVALAKAADVTVDELLGLAAPERPGVRPVQVMGVANAVDARGGIVRDDHGAYRQSIALPEGAHLVRVCGDSMVPIALDGQAVWVVDAKPGDGDLAVIEPRDGPMLFKRVYRRDHGWECVSANPAPEFKPVSLRDAEVRRIRKVVGTWWGC